MALGALLGPDGVHSFRVWPGMETGSRQPPTWLSGRSAKPGLPAVTAQHSHRTVWARTLAHSHTLAVTLDLPPHHSGFTVLICHVRIMMGPPHRVRIRSPGGLTALYPQQVIKRGLVPTRGLNTGVQGPPASGAWASRTSPTLLRGRARQASAQRGRNGSKFSSRRRLPAVQAFQSQH